MTRPRSVSIALVAALLAVVVSSTAATAGTDSVRPAGQWWADWDK
ncbi:MAG TPA: hypothetical protein VHC49_15580 [Mycobacteriales bacterium]|nr:hypothetical protein [Mycobacteriales bacterium]